MGESHSISQDLNISHDDDDDSNLSFPELGMEGTFQELILKLGLLSNSHLSVYVWGWPHSVALLYSEMPVLCVTLQVDPLTPSLLLSLWTHTHSHAHTCTQTSSHTRTKKPSNTNTYRYTHDLETFMADTHLNCYF